MSESVPANMSEPALAVADGFDVFGPPPLLRGENRSTYDALLARVASDVNPKDTVERRSDPAARRGECGATLRSIPPFGMTRSRCANSANSANRSRHRTYRHYRHGRGAAIAASRRQMR